MSELPELRTTRLGLVPYEEARSMQRALEAARLAAEVPDVLLLLEHPPVYTRGRRSTPAELPMGEDWYARQGIEVADTDRGGRVTYHGPGQLVAYPIISLRDLSSRTRPGGGTEEPVRVVEFIRAMERAMIAALGDWGVDAQVIEALTGVWTPGDPPPTGAARKIGSIGLHISRGVSTHGLAINVNNDLQPFEWIVPCGIEAVRMTSLARERGAEQDLDAFGTSIAHRLAEVYGRRLTEAEPDEILGPLGLKAA